MLDVSGSQRKFDLRPDWLLSSATLTFSFLVATGFARENNTFRNGLIGLTALSGVAYVFLTAAQDSRASRVRLMAVSPLVVLYTGSLAIAAIYTSTFSSQLVALCISAFIFYSGVPMAILRKPGRLMDWLKAIQMLGLCSIPFAILPLLGVHSFIGLPLQMKDVYAQASGVPAVAGIMEVPLIFGMFMAIVAIVSAYLFFLERRRKHIVIAALCTGMIFLAQARGSMAAVGCAVIVFASPRALLTRGRYLILVVVAIVLSAALSYYIIASSPALSSFFRLSHGLSGRDVIWGVAAFMIAKQPWLGYGFGMSTVFTASIGDTLEALGFNAVGAPFHNTYMTYAFENGLVSLVFYLLLFLWPMWLTANSKMPLLEKRFFIGICIGLFTADLTMDNNIGGCRITSLALAIFNGLAYASALYYGRATSKKRRPFAELKLEDGHPVAS